MLGIETLATAGWLVLAGSAGCAVPKAPEIRVSPVSASIQYEYNLSSAELDTFKTSTVSPYAPGTDTSTGGLRHDRPEVKTEIKWGVQHDPIRQTVCFWYESINITIALNPKIYIARDKQKNPACLEAIKGHEIKHVNADREVINRYAREIGNVVKAAVDGAGAMGPYPYNELEDVQKRLVEHVGAAVDSRKFMLYQDMARRQALVDSLEEYERVSKICEEKK